MPSRAEEERDAGRDGGWTRWLFRLPPFISLLWGHRKSFTLAAFCAVNPIIFQWGSERSLGLLRFLCYFGFKRWSTAVSICLVLPFVDHTIFHGGILSHISLIQWVMYPVTSSYPYCSLNLHRKHHLLMIEPIRLPNINVMGGPLLLTCFLPQIWNQNHLRAPLSLRVAYCAEIIMKQGVCIKKEVVQFLFNINRPT